VKSEKRKAKSEKRKAKKMHAPLLSKLLSEKIAQNGWKTTVVLLFVFRY
jgi:hypothetical protein